MRRWPVTPGTESAGTLILGFGLSTGELRGSLSPSVCVLSKQVEPAKVPSALPSCKLSQMNKDQLC